MKRTKTIFLFAIIVFLGACRENRKEPANKSKMQQVMAVHDEVMPKMGTLGKLVEEIKPLVDSTETGQEYGKAMNALQDSHKAMMDWMQGFGSRFNSEEILDGKPLSAEKQQWLDEEEKKVLALRDQINGSIKNAEMLLDTE